MLQKTCATCQRTYASEGDFLRGTTRWRVCTLGHLWFNCNCGSTLVLIKGTYPWYAPTKAMSDDAAGVFNRLANKASIPRVPSVVMEITRLLEEPEINVPAIAKLLRAEPVISAFLIAAANNMKAATGTKITSLEHAVVYVGKKALAELVQVSGLSSFQPKTGKFKRERFWRESQLAGFATEQVARSFAPAVGNDLAFLAGSLANIGKLLAAILHPEDVDDLVGAQANPKTVGNWRLHETDEIDHTILGEIAAVLWGLPPFVRDACARHHDLTKLFIPNGPQFAPSLVDVTAVGVQLAHWIDLEAFQIERDILDAFRARMGLGEAELEQFASGLIVQAKSLRI
jgi:HD-like signal output (HDOD) protein